jgi:hypothetical protein
MSHQHGGIIQIVDEGGCWLMSVDQRYHGGARGFYLKS